MHLYRSWLFAPANNARQVSKALSLQADVVVLDLEDACPPEAKAEGRAAAAEALRKPRTSLGYVRINAMDSIFAYRDLEALIGKGFDGLVLPKVSRPQDVEIADWLIGQLERERGLPPHGTDLVPMIETAAAMADVRVILRASPRVKRCVLGAVDLALALGLEPSREEIELQALRTSLVVAARAEGKEPPIDSPYMSVADTEGFKHSVARARALGFQGKLCIHPSQVEPANAGFLPTERQLKEARRIVEAFEAARARGAAVTLLDGNLVELPVVERARALLDAARASAAPGSPAQSRRV